MWIFYFYKILPNKIFLSIIPANGLRDFALQSMFELLITIVNRQLSDITSRYALRAVDLKDMAVIDL